tara:strand:+ start:1027 stop:2202 length:1176 start_codon:yes stop_codon:yes gene_type:complete
MGGYEMTEEFTFTRSLGNGRWDRKLKERMTELSVADNYDDAKHEWIATGNVWWEQVGDRRPDWAKNHPDKCLCGHKIVYHFEIHNTENDVRECVGSDHINSYLILRAIKEETGLSEKYITDDMIDEWITVRVKSLKKDAWWNINGEGFTKMFDAVKDYDLRVNVLESGTYYDSELRMHRPRTRIRKRASGTYPQEDYRMASIVWRWNHPDNKKAQINTNGFPNESLMNDLVYFFTTIENAKAKIRAEEDFVEKRKKYLEEHDKKVAERIARIEVSKQVREDMDEPEFIQACEYYDISPFNPSDNAFSAWEKNFLSDMKRRMVAAKELSEAQLNTLYKIVASEEEMQKLGIELERASSKQISYLRRLGYEGDVDNLSKRDASRLINEIKSVI